jgi:hypothetical protein
MVTIPLDENGNPNFDTNRLTNEKSENELEELFKQLAVVQRKREILRNDTSFTQTPAEARFMQQQEDKLIAQIQTNQNNTNITNNQYSTVTQPAIDVNYGNLSLN